MKRAWPVLSVSKDVPSSRLHVFWRWRFGRIEQPPTTDRFAAGWIGIDATEIEAYHRRHRTVARRKACVEILIEEENVMNRSHVVGLIVGFSLGVAITSIIFLANRPATTSALASTAAPSTKPIAPEPVRTNPEPAAEPDAVPSSSEG